MAELMRVVEEKNRFAKLLASITFFEVKKQFPNPIWAVTDLSRTLRCKGIIGCQTGLESVSSSFPNLHLHHRRYHQKLRTFHRKHSHRFVMYLVEDSSSWLMLLHADCANTRQQSHTLSSQSQNTISRIGKYLIDFTAIFHFVFYIVWLGTACYPTGT